MSLELLDAFDTWFEKMLKRAAKKRGEDPDTATLHPQLKMGWIAETNADGEVTKRKRVKGVKKKKVRKAKTKQGVYSGTKKAYTMELAAKGLSKERVIRKVLRKFPDANEKSIGIWYNKSK